LRQHPLSCILFFEHQTRNSIRAAIKVGRRGFISYYHPKGKKMCPFLSTLNYLLLFGPNEIIAVENRPLKLREEKRYSRVRHGGTAFPGANIPETFQSK
jgi:hypothetical protein